MLNEWIIATNSNLYRIAEIEFYVKYDKHIDPFTHGNKLQKTSGRWYLHPSGLDLTIGDENNFASILIRAVQKLDKGFKPINEGYTYGPLNVLTELFSIMDAYEGTLKMQMIKAPINCIENEEVIAAPRVGLSAKKNEEFSKKNYRFLIYPKKKHADKTKIAEAMRLNGHSEDRIKGIWG